MKALLIAALFTAASAEEADSPSAVDPEPVLVEVGVITAVLGLAITAGSIAGALGVATELDAGVYDDDADFQSGQTLGLVLLGTAGLGVLVTGAGVGLTFLE